MSLEQWAANHWLRQAQASPQAIRQLLGIADREIGDASLDGISSDGRFTHAYDAVRALADAALRATGYEVFKGERTHERVIESLRFTALADAGAEVDYLDQCRRLRHKLLYVGTGASEREAAALLDAARALRGKVREWLTRKHPGLLAQ